jgi:hypothetical protein
MKYEQLNSTSPEDKRGISLAKKCFHTNLVSSRQQNNKWKHLYLSIAAALNVCLNSQHKTVDSAHRVVTIQEAD